eukprot:m.346949 g.346949  ORF g.346949 m.346949 type:complete len:329 (+) comp30824_c0_seq1:617-1603(+)
MTATKLWKACQRFIEAHIAVIPKHIPFLKHVISRTQTVNKEAYEATMEVIKGESMFTAYTTKTDKAAKLAEETYRNEIHQTTSDIVMLYKHADRVRDRFLKFLTNCANIADVEMVLQHNREVETKRTGLYRRDHKEGARLVLKKRSTVLQKVGLRPDSENRWKCENIFNLVRGTIQCQQMTALYSVFDLILACDEKLPCERDKKQTRNLLFKKKPSEAKIVVVRISDRFAAPTSGGWAVTIINFYFADDSNKHICEIQLVHSQLMAVRKQLDAHVAYNQFKAARDLLESINHENSQTQNLQKEIEKLKQQQQRQQDRIDELQQRETKM